jgi:hypothetical protein
VGGSENGLGVDAQLSANPKEEPILEGLLAIVLVGLVYDSLVPVLHNSCPMAHD